VPVNWITGKGWKGIDLCIDFAGDYCAGGKRQENLREVREMRGITYRGNT